MRNPRFIFALVLGAALAGATFLVGCGSDDGNNPMTPTTGPTWSSGALGNGGSFQRTFTENGSWNYLCTFHTGMTGTINVDPATANPDSVIVNIMTTGGRRFEPSTVTVQTGGYVRWVNQATEPHNTVRQ